MTIRREDILSIDFADDVTGDRLAPVTPADILRHEFQEPMNLSARGLARDMGVPVTRITEILHGKRSLTAETALHLARRFDTSAEFWLNLQNAHDREIARENLG